MTKLIEILVHILFIAMLLFLIGVAISLAVVTIRFILAGAC